MSSRRSLRELLVQWRGTPELVEAAPAVPDIEFAFACRQALRLLRRRGAEWPVGDYLQFGLGCAAFMACVYHMLEAEGLWHVRLFGFDRLENAEGVADGEAPQPEAFRAMLEARERYFRRAGINWARIELTTGALVPELRERLRLEGASLIMLGCAGYGETREALRFAEPLIRDQAVLFLNDYKSPNSNTHRLAFAKFCAEFSQMSVLDLPSYAPRARVVLVSRTSSWRARSEHR